MNAIWVGRMRERLLSWHGSHPGWGYRPDGDPFVEPTALAALALSATAELDEVDACRSTLQSSMDWLAAIQHADGSLGLSESIAAPHWTTPLAALAWQACGCCDEARRRAIRWLLTQRGNTSVSSTGTPLSHDAAIPGWSWVEGTHSWLEPTSWAVLALVRAGQSGHLRVDDGRRLIRDRALRSGGWNYGNSQVFGTDLRAQPGPTGLALLALAGADDADAPRIRNAVDYLIRVLPSTRAPQSMCWGLLGLTAWGQRPIDAEEWLEAAIEKAIGRSDRAVQLSYLLLASAPDALEFLGVERTNQGEPL